MAQNTSARYLVTYDIVNPRRLGRVFRYLKKEGVPVQYSVFLVETSAVKLGQIMGHLARLIDADADDVRAYRLPDNGWQISMGAGILPDDVLPGGITLKADPALTTDQLGTASGQNADKQRCKLLSQQRFSGAAK